MFAAKPDKIRVLVVDDSSFMRLAISAILSRDPGIEVAGVAVDGVEAVEKAMVLQPDLITMDVEMPRLDGIGALKEIMAKAPTRVLMVSTLTREGARETFAALEAGAVDYIFKNLNEPADSGKAFRDELLRKVKGFFPARGDAFLPGKPLPMPKDPVRGPSGVLPRHITSVVIGASTGGPVALQKVLSGIAPGFPYPIMVGIHMPRLFTGPYAEHLNAKCPLEIREAVDGDLLMPGRVLISPGGRHTVLVRQGGRVVIKTVLPADYPQYIYTPSVDLLMISLADACRGPVFGVILTGMGSDGFQGMQYLKTKGGVTLAQDEATSTIYGMPRACIRGGVADLVLPLDKIGQEITKLAG